MIVQVLRKMGVEVHDPYNKLSYKKLRDKNAKNKGLEKRYL